MYSVPVDRVNHISDYLKYEEIGHVKVWFEER